MSTPSIFSAIKKLRVLFTRKEKIRWIWIALFAVAISFLELITAAIIVVFVQILNAPEIAQKYLSILGIVSDISARHTILYLSLTVGVVYLIKNGLAVAEVFFQNISIQNMNYKFKNKLLNHYAQSDYGVYLMRNSSWYAQVLHHDTKQVFSFGMVALAMILSDSIVFIALISMIIYMNPFLFLMVFVIIAFVAVFIAKGVLPQFYAWGQKLQAASVQSHQKLLQFFHAFKEIVLLGKSKSFIEAYKYHSQQECHTEAVQMATNHVPRMGIEVLFVGIFVLTTSYLALTHETPAQMMGILGGYLYAGFRLMPGLNRMISQLNVFKSVIPSIERLYDEYTSNKKKDNYVEDPHFHFKEAIYIKGVSFQYLSAQKRALSNINLVIKKKETLGIIGETGSGKSTLVDLILGLLKPCSGSLLIDDQFSTHSHQWHQKIGYVPQSIYLIDDTIQENIIFGGDDDQRNKDDGATENRQESNEDRGKIEEKNIIDQDKLDKAIDDSQLRSFIEDLPMGVKTVVGEQGVRLSGGERQRIAIARALYRQPEVLIFDEATSALDTETEERLMKTIDAVSQHRTVIMIAHRLTTLKSCDRIVVMNKGSIENITTYNQIA